LFYLTSQPRSLLYTLSLHDALPIFLDSLGKVGVCFFFAPIFKRQDGDRFFRNRGCMWHLHCCRVPLRRSEIYAGEHQRRCRCNRSEEHTSELQSRSELVCRLLLEKK